MLVGAVNREATVQLHPAELGRLHVTISTEGDHARVLFVTETAHAREAIEQSLPRLRELLQQSGLDLAQGDVSYREPSQGGGEREPSPGLPGLDASSGQAGADGDDTLPAGGLALRLDGLLDTFA